ncbi:MAG: hypothetical protein J5I92_01185 [Thiogranum sp.]|nr:hypothetical protein [Thiogranum sp.]
MINIHVIATQGAIKMNEHVKTLATMAILTTFTVIAGCAITGKELVGDNTVKVEKISSEWGVVTFVSVVQEGDEVALRGEVRRRPIGRGSIPGHIDVEVLDSSGATLERMSTDYRRLSIKSRYAKFDANLGTIPPSGSTIRVIHHDAGPHDSM